MATPTGITLGAESIIVESVDDAPVNTRVSINFAGGYVRQIGNLVFSCNVGDFVQYDSTGSFSFQQADVTYVLTNNSKILFIQAAAV